MLIAKWSQKRLADVEHWTSAWRLPLAKKKPPLYLQHTMHCGCCWCCCCGCRALSSPCTACPASTFYSVIHHLLAIPCLYSPCASLRWPDESSQAAVTCLVVLSYSTPRALLHPLRIALRSLHKDELARNHQKDVCTEIVLEMREGVGSLILISRSQTSCL
jgi:hypothetical protein